MFASKCGGKLGKRMYKRIDRMYDSRDGGYVFNGTFWNMFFYKMFRSYYKCTWQQLKLALLRVSVGSQIIDPTT